MLLTRLVGALSLLARSLARHVIGLFMICFCFSFISVPVFFFFLGIKFHDAIIACKQLANKCRARNMGSESFFASLYKVIYHCDGLLNFGS